MRRYPPPRKQVSAALHFVASANRRVDLTRPSIELTIAEATPSQNELSGLHPMTLHKLRNKWDGLVLEALSRQKAIGFFPGRRKTTMTVLRVGKGTLDVDNLIAGTKILTDRLRHYGLIVDDNETWLKAEYTQRRCGRGEIPHTIVRVSWTG